MTDDELDLLFRKALTQQSDISGWVPGAWEQLAPHLSKLDRRRRKRKLLLWVGVIWGLLLLPVSGVLIWLYTSVNVLFFPRANKHAVPLQEIMQPAPARREVRAAHHITTIAPRNTEAESIPVREDITATYILEKLAVKQAAHASVPLSLLRPVPAPLPVIPATSAGKPRGVPHSWQVSLTAGPGLGIVKGRASGGAGSTIGILLQYRFAKRWSVESGVLLTDLKYSAAPADYDPPGGYGSSLQHIRASCNIIDVPLNIRFDALQSPHSNAFISAGLSSFWMKKEDYQFTYKVNNNLETRQWSIGNQNRHLMSIANLSAGYEYRWNRLALQGGPYLKLPLSGIGYGRVKATGAGVLVAVKYGL